MDVIKIGKFIQRKRKENGLTQSDLAEKLGVTDRAVSKWENGVCLPDADNIFELCNILKVSVDCLFNGEETMDSGNEKMEKNLVEALKLKEESDKRLLCMEVVIGVLVSVVLFACILLASYLEMPTWLRLVIIGFGAIIFLIGVFFALRIEQKAGYYQCAKCNYKYVPTYTQINFAMHIGRTRYMKCPHCKKRSWQRKVLSGQSNEVDDKSKE